MKKIYYLFTILSILGFFWQCKSTKTKKSTAGFYKYEVECEGSEMDGSQLVRAFGTGKNREDAIEQAKKIAIHAVIFKGVRLGEQGCQMKPLVYNMNAEEEYQDYFNGFFKDGGKFQDFISTKDVPGKTKIKEKGEGREKAFGIIVTVKVPELKKELISKGIVKPNTSIE